MKTIELTKGQVAIVDDEDYEWLNSMKWHARRTRSESKYYAEHSYRVRGTKIKVNVSMHGLLLKEAKMVDHINGNGLDNRKENLRPCNNRENHQNIPKYRMKCSSKYKGVSKRKGTERWRATIRINGKHIELGSFQIEEDAARAYDAAAEKYFGQFANLNFKKD